MNNSVDVSNHDSLLPESVINFVRSEFADQGPFDSFDPHAFLLGISECGYLTDGLYAYDPYGFKSFNVLEEFSSYDGNTLESLRDYALKRISQIMLLGTLRYFRQNCLIDGKEYVELAGEFTPCDSVRMFDYENEWYEHSDGGTVLIDSLSRCNLLLCIISSKRVGCALNVYFALADPTINLTTSTSSIMCDLSSGFNGSEY